MNLGRQPREIFLFGLPLLMSLALWIAIPQHQIGATSTIVTVDDVGDVGQFSSLALNNVSNNDPLISYYNTSSNSLRLVRCLDTLCTNKSFTMIDTNAGRYTSLKLQSDGIPFISYTRSNGDLSVAQCANTLCTSNGVLTYWNPSHHVYKDTSLALIFDAPKVSYYDSTYGDVNLQICFGDIFNCGQHAANISVDAVGDTGRSTSIAVINTLPTISYYDATNADLRLAICGESYCQIGKTLTTVDSVGDVGRDTSLVASNSGFPIISYYDATNGDLKVAACADLFCTNKTLTVVDSAGDVGQFTSMTLSPDGYPVISYYDATNGDLKIAVCGNITCSHKTITTVDSTGDVGRYTSIKIRGDYRIFISYYDVTNGDLKLVTDDTIALSLPLRPDTVGVYANGVFYLRNTNSAGAADITVSFGGDPSDLPVAGDWNGDGIDTIGVYRGSTGTYHLSNSNTVAAAFYSFVFGNPGDTPFAGKWTADMTHDGLGVYRNSNGILYQKKQLTTGFSDYFAIFGNPGDQGISGDWDGDGFDSVGIYRSSNQTWFLSNNSTPSGITFSDIDFAWNLDVAEPVLGDWNGDGTTNVGYLTAASVFTLHPNNASAGTDTVFSFGPTGGKPVAGNWIGTGRPAVTNVIIHVQPGIPDSQANTDGSAD